MKYVVMNMRSLKQYVTGQWQRRKKYVSNKLYFLKTLRYGVSAPLTTVEY